MRFLESCKPGFALLTALALLSSCVNVFAPIDNPSGDAQLLSAARAAFDAGDIAGAREHYEKLGSNEIAKSELLFVDLESCGAGIDTFATALAKGADSLSSPGILLTIMAEKMNATHGTRCFSTLLSSYQQSLAITDANLRGFTSFLAALAIAGEVLAHNAGIASTGELRKTEYLGLDPSSCSGGTCAPGCAKSDGIAVNASVVDLSSATSISADWGTLQGAIVAIDGALTLLGVSQGASLSLIANLQGGSAITGSPFLYRCLLNDPSVGVGR